MDRRTCRFVATAGLAVALAAALQTGAPFTAQAQFDGYWTRLDDAFPPGRRAAGYAYDSHRNRLVVFGGYNGAGAPYLNDAWALMLGTQKWQSLPAAPPDLTARYGPTAVYDAANDRLIVFGGFDGTTQNNDVWQLTFSGTPQWTKLNPSGTPPPGRSFHVAAYDAVHQRMIVFGGYNGDGDSNAFLGDTWQLTLSGSPAWSALSFTQATPPPRNLAGVTVDVLRNRLLLFGGWDGTYRDDLWALPLTAGAEWIALPAGNRPSPRREVSIAYDSANDRIVTFGGNDGQLQGDTWALPLAGSLAWQSLSASTPPPPRYGHATVYGPVAGRVVLFAGLDTPNATGPHSRRVWGFDAGSAVWTELAPQPRVRNYSLVRDHVSGRLLMFGGETPGLTNRLLSFNAATNIWEGHSLAPPGSIPTARYAHRAVWDAARDRMLVFGGYDGSFRNDLWEFRPRPDPVWTELYPGGALPPPRFAGGLVLDAERDRLIAFGGYRTVTNPVPPPTDIPAVFNDVWALPLSGTGAMTWQQLAPAGTAPTPRWGHVMVMDAPRDRALVFGGGETAESGLSDLHALNLAVDPPVWSLLPSPVSPPGRVIHAGVIDTDRDALVIYGGFGGSPSWFLDDVWIYPLSGSSWISMAPSNPTPTPRDAIGAVYDPVTRRIIIPAGWGPSGLLADTWALAWQEPVAAQASLRDVHAAPGLVRLTWFVRDADGMVASVWRHEPAGEWESRGGAVRDGGDRATYEDREVTPGATYFYRLELRGGGESFVTDEIAVTVPSGHRLELAGAWPNPAPSDRLSIAFSLSRRGPARLELLDVAGRRVAVRDMGVLEAGAHQASFQRENLAPGLYLIRFRAEDRVLAGRVMVVR